MLLSYYRGTPSKCDANSCEHSMENIFNCLHIYLNNKAEQNLIYTGCRIFYDICIVQTEYEML